MYLFIYLTKNVFNLYIHKVSSITGRDDSWTPMVPSVVPIGDRFHISIHYIH